MDDPQAQMLIRDLVTHYFEIYGSRSVVEDPGTLSEIVSGEYLTWLQSLVERSDSDRWPITVALDLREVVVLDYSPNRFRSIICGVWTYRRDSRRTVFPQTFIRIVSVVEEEGKWKMTASFDFTDSSIIRRGEWEYAPEWMKRELGNVPDIAPEYETCGMH
ncbi:MAG: hypothetical protein IPK19_15095 [Chloroflexi bacterium]|nr:hypothetical protein [Chloroflexota bacterium]